MCMGINMGVVSMSDCYPRGPGSMLFKRLTEFPHVYPTQVVYKIVYLAIGSVGYMNV